MKTARQASRVTVMAGIGLVVAACTTGGFARRPAERVTAPATQTSTAGDLSVYLEPLRALIEGDPLTQADTVRRVADQADIAPTTTNRLMYALVLALPGHPGSNAAEAQRRLTALLAAGDALLPAERLLAMVELRDVEQRLVLEVATADLRSELAAAAASNDAAAEQRIQGLIEQNRQLQAELDEATSKLNAITTIEQSVRELENGTD